MESVAFTKTLFIDSDDFALVPPPKFFRMKPDSEVRLMGAYIVKCNEVICDDEGNVKEIHCTADLETGCGMPVDGRKVKGTIHWVSESNCEDITVRLYDKLFTLRDTGDLPEGKTYADFMNPESVVELKHCKAEKGIGEGEADHFPPR